jgi:hypothetical protein
MDPFEELRKKTEALFKEAQATRQAALIAVEWARQASFRSREFRAIAGNLKARIHGGASDKDNPPEPGRVKVLREEHANGSISGHTELEEGPRVGHQPQE